MEFLYYSKTELRIVLTGGGTGGHIFPLVAIARGIKKELKESEVQPTFLFLGPDDFSLDVFGKEGIETRKITSGKIRRYFDLKNFLSPFKLVIGFIQALKHLYSFMPDVVISKGGYGAVPVVLAAWLYRIPVLIHESDSVPGLATRFTARIAKKICLSFEKSLDFFPSKKVVLTGNPIRFSNTEKVKIEEAVKDFNLDSQKPTLLVLGGSQGSQPLNDFVLNILADLISNGVQVIHQVGEKNYLEMKKEVEISLVDFLEEEKKTYHLMGFLNEGSYREAMVVSNLVLARAGSGTIFELAFFAKPSILVPFPFASQDHQRINAYEYAEKGGAIIIEQENLLPHLVVHEIIDLIKDKEKLQKMSEGAKSFAKPAAAKKIAEEAIKLAIK